MEAGLAVCAIVYSTQASICVPPAQPSPAQGCEAETQAGSWKSRHGRAAGLLGLKHGCEKRIWRDSPASVGQVELVSAGLSRGTS